MTDFFEPWLIFKNPIVRQLAFVIASPNILRQIPADLSVVHSFELHDDLFWQQHFHAYKPRLLQLDEDPEELIMFISKLKSTRLGLRFEYLMWFWLQDAQYHQFQIIGHSIQIIDGKNTVGELDFVVLNQSTQQIEHWEVALKFYLAESSLELSQWYGLNRSDTLLRKLKHFTEKQFQFKKIILAEVEHKIERKFSILKGQLYLPRDLEIKPSQTHDRHAAKIEHAIPTWINCKRRLGTWSNYLQTDFYRLERQEWICSHQKQSSADAIFWYDGLYRNFNTCEDFMFRQAKLLKSTVDIM